MVSRFVRQRTARAPLACLLLKTRVRRQRRHQRVETQVLSNASVSPAGWARTSKPSPATREATGRVSRFRVNRDRSLSTASATTPGWSASAINSVSLLPRAARTSRYSSSFEKADLKSPATTVALLKMNAVVGLQATVDANNHITRLGVTCALCHSTVDNSVMPGIGRRKDGWPNRDLNVGAIIALSPALAADKKAVYGAGVPANKPALQPGRQEHAARPPPAYGLARIKNETTRRRDRSPIGMPMSPSPRGRARQLLRPAARDRRQAFAGHGHDKLPALRAYQHSLPSPPPPAGSFDAAVADRDACVFDRTCASCHVGGSSTDNNDGKLHPPAETGVDGAYAARTANKAYRTTPLRGPGSTRRTSTTAARQPSPTSWRTTTGFAHSVSPRISSESSSSI